MSAKAIYRRQTERFKELAEKLNELMESEDLINENKAIPYLGWWWRDISPDIPRLTLSWPSEDGPGWIDEARKWGYLSKIVEISKSIEILEACITVVEANIKLVKLLKQEQPEEGVP